MESGAALLYLNCLSWHTRAGTLRGQLASAPARAFSAMTVPPSSNARTQRVAKYIERKTG